MNTVTGYHFDSENLFYDGERIVQELDGVPNFPPCVIGAKPALKAGYWYQCKNKTSWTAIKKPTTCAEAIEMNLSAVANSPKEHDREVVALIQSLVNAESENYRIKTDSETLVMSIEAIPEPTEEEKEIAEQNLKLQEGQEASEAIQKSIVTAIALGDDEWLADLKAEYQALIEEE